MDQIAGGEFSRRQFIRDAGVAAAAVTQLTTAPAMAMPRNNRRAKRQTVAVFGGGIAGMTAAHELAEHGFEVAIYERRAWGGKARSTEVPDSARGGRKPLPGEHGARFAFAGYRHLPDTMGRIPFGANANGVLDNLVAAPQFDIARDGGRADVIVPGGELDPRPYTPVQATDLLVGALQSLPPEDAFGLVSRLVVFLSSGLARRQGEWEYQSWFDFLHAGRYSDSYRKIWGGIITRIASASTPETESARVAGEAFEMLGYLELTGRARSRILNLPTNEAWINPWLAHLGNLGVKLERPRELVGFDLRDGRIAGAQVRGRHGVRHVHADWYVSALPVERASRLWNRAMCAADPQLQRAASITTRWMNGIQFYLREQRPIVKGIMLYCDSPWGIGSVSQTQFWTDRDFARDYGDGSAREDLSAFITDATTPGILYGKTAQQCTGEEIAREVWEQMKRHTNKPGRTPVLSDDLLHSWHLDPGLIRRRGGWIDEDQLWISTPGSIKTLPTAATAIPNLVLGASYVRNDFLDVDCMETANLSGRLAATAILAGAGSRATPPQIFERRLPAEWAELRNIDDRRYAQGQPNLFDTDMTAAQFSHMLGATSENLASLLR